MPSRPIAAFDPEGLIFAAGIGNEVVKLYDLRSFDKVFLINLVFCERFGKLNKYLNFWIFLYHIRVFKK